MLLAGLGILASLSACGLLSSEQTSDTVPSTGTSEDRSIEGPSETEAALAALGTLRSYRFFGTQTTVDDSKSTTFNIKGEYAEPGRIMQALRNSTGETVSEYYWEEGHHCVKSGFQDWKCFDILPGQTFLSKEGLADVIMGGASWTSVEIQLAGIEEIERYGVSCFLFFVEYLAQTFEPRFTGEEAEGVEVRSEVCLDATTFLPVAAGSFGENVTTEVEFTALNEPITIEKPGN
jgi:hypothetical protein